jgi:hypothetical protein
MAKKMNIGGIGTHGHNNFVLLLWLSVLTMLFFTTMANYPGKSLQFSRTINSFLIKDGKIQKLSKELIENVQSF